MAWDEGCAGPVRGRGWGGSAAARRGAIPGAVGCGHGGGEWSGVGRRADGRTGRGRGAHLEDWQHWLLLRTHGSLVNSISAVLGCIDTCHNAHHYAPMMELLRGRRRRGAMRRQRGGGRQIGGTRILSAQAHAPRARAGVLNAALAHAQCSSNRLGPGAPREAQRRARGPHPHTPRPSGPPPGARSARPGHAGARDSSYQPSGEN